MNHLLKLKRDIGLFGTTAYILGVIIGAGIYVIIGKTAGITGNSIWLSFLIAAVIAACTGLSYAELASTFPYDSAEYLYSQRSFRDRRFSFGVAWLKLISLVIGISAVALGFGGYLSSLIGLNHILGALLLLVLLTVFNLVGVKQAIGFDIAMVLIAIAGLLLVIGIGMPHIQAPEFYWEMPHGFSGVLTGAALIFFAFLGFENIGNLSEEVKDPKRTLPIALIASVLISTVLYILVAIVSVSVIPWDQLADSTAPLSDVMTVLIGSKAGMLMAVMALAATASTVLGLMIGSSRMIYGLAEENSMPKIFLKVTKKGRAPYVAVIAVAIIAAIFIIPGEITSIAFLTNFGAMFVFLVVNLCVIVLRYSHDHITRAFQVPGRIGKFPIIPAIGILTCAGLLFSFEKKMFFGGILLFLVGLVLYSMFGERKRAPEATGSAHKLVVSNPKAKSKKK
ncbi:MAG: APC family permease [Candidatus Woesearchaeota archaeon]